MSADNDSYDNKLDGLICALDDKGPDELTRALLAEVEAARALIGHQMELPETDRVLQAVRDRLSNTITASECELYGTALNRYIHDYTHTHRFATTRRGKALVNYWQACASLTSVETNGNSSYFLCFQLMDFTLRWTGCSEIEVRCEQLDHLEAALDPSLLWDPHIPEGRGRISMLAD